MQNLNKNTEAILRKATFFGTKMTFKDNVKKGHVKHVLLKSKTSNISPAIELSDSKQNSSVQISTH